MEKFEGTKFYVAAEYMARNEDIWWDEVYEKKAVFEMTWSYKKYLKKKREEEKANRLSSLRARLEWQYKHYGKVDPIDFQEFMEEVKRQSK